ncbi:MAG TPA: amino acid adenylation domain-containing protein [Streptosporangiaceae bacterium]|nr:amino acid adenylation domain-containing protein [Streptosporangiaceae bacterium]
MVSESPVAAGNAVLTENIVLPGGEWRLWSQFALRGPGFPASGVLRLVPEGLSAAAAGFGQDEPLDGDQWLDFERRFELAMVSTARELQEIAALPLFRAAVAWQNRSVLDSAFASFARWEPRAGSRSSMVRQREELIAHYWQRFCVKNDTIGFFGPVGWGVWDDTVEGVAVDPGTGLIARSEVYFASWAIDALARCIGADPELRPWLAPRRVPYLRLGHGEVGIPARPAQPAALAELRLLEICDGTRPLAALASELSVRMGRDLTEEAVVGLLDGMLAKRWISWRLETPSGPHPDRQLRAVLERVGDSAVRERALAKLAVLEGGRERVRAVLGDAQGLVAALTALENDFAALTATTAKRDKGARTAPCRSPLYSDCRRSATARLGTKLVDELVPLEFCLASARWMTGRYADVVGARIREAYERLRARHGTVDLGSLWFATLPAPHAESIADATRVRDELRQRWAAIINAPPGARRVDLRSADIADRVWQAFAEPGGGWWLSRYASPDLLIVADDADALARGDYQLLIGELHCAMNTISASLFMMQHPDIKELLDETTSDFPGPRIVPMLPHELPKRWSVRSQPALIRDEDYYVALVDHTIDPHRPRTVMSADVAVQDRDGRLVVVLPGGTEFDLLDVYCHALTNRVIDQFTIRPDADHSPRITVDRVILARETWRFTAGDADAQFAAEKNEARRFVRTGWWRRAHDLPRFAFVVSPAEPRPFYVDFESPVYVNIFTKAVRRLARKGTGEQLVISEMLPTPEQTWLTDDRGQRYTSELRLVAVARDQSRRASTVVDDIRAQAVRDPDAIALVTPTATISYGEFADRVERLARVLAAAGVRTDDRCVVALEPGADAVVAMTAVLRAGGAFVTLDIQQPAQRLATMVRSACAAFQLTTTALASRLALPVNGPAILLDRLDGMPELPPPAQIASRSLAYVSHTSGSTGAPHAVLVEHRGLRAFLRSVVRECGLGRHNATLQLGPLGWDASIRDTFAPLMSGGRLILLPRSVLLRPDALLDAIEAYGADTILSTTPSFLTALASHDGTGTRLRNLRLVVSSAESLRPYLAAGNRRLTGGRLFNLYGPTECTVTATRYEVPQEPDTSTDLIGTPLDGVTVYLLDPRLHAVPEGAVGEIYIGGAGVARGYLAEPGVTAGKFVPDPLAAVQGARMYRTGDLGRRRPDGNIEFLGRSDRQVKIRGYRVEPAEIEGALLRHPAVRAAVVTAAADERGRGYLTAHIAGDLADVTDAALRAFLALRLAPHLLPRRFMRVDQLPTTRTGKVDWAALTARVPTEGLAR